MAKTATKGTKSTTTADALAATVTRLDQARSVLADVEAKMPMGEVTGAQLAEARADVEVAEAAVTAARAAHDEAEATAKATIRQETTDRIARGFGVISEADMTDRTTPGLVSAAADVLAAAYSRNAAIRKTAQDLASVGADAATARTEGLQAHHAGGKIMIPTRNTTYGVGSVDLAKLVTAILAEHTDDIEDLAVERTHPASALLDPGDIPTPTDPLTFTNDPAVLARFAQLMPQRVRLVKYLKAGSRGIGGNVDETGMSELTDHRLIGTEDAQSGALMVKVRVRCLVSNVPSQSQQTMDLHAVEATAQRGLTDLVGHVEPGLGEIVRTEVADIAGTSDRRARVDVITTFRARKTDRNVDGS